MANVTYTADMQQVVNSFAQIHNSLQGQVAQFKSASAAISDYNAKTNQWTTTVRGALTSGEQFVAKLREVNGQLQVTNLRTLSTDFRMLGATGEQTASALAITWDRFKTIFTGQVIKQGINELIQALSEGARQAIELQQKISLIRTISQDADMSFSQWSGTIRKLSDQFALPQADVAAAAYEALSNQVVQGAEASKFLGESFKFAMATGSSAADSVNLLSSVINSYKMSADDAEKISASLFRTIDLGRVTATDLANSYGRILPVAQQLGVEFNEVNAAISTLTRLGVAPSDAMTQMLNVMIKLVKPTEEMQKLFERWGVSSGPAAVGTFKFAGVLEKLSKETGGNVAEFAKFFNEIRGLRGAIGLGEEFAEDLAKISTGTEKYAEAVKIMRESAGRELTEEFTKIKNFFINDVGTPLIEGFNAIIKAIAQFTGIGTGFADVIMFISKTVGYAIVAVTTYIGLLATWRGLSLAMTGIILAKNAAIALATTATWSWNAALTATGITLNTLLAGIPALIAVITTTVLALNSASAQTKDIGDNLQKISEFATKEAKEKAPIMLNVDFSEERVKAALQQVNAIGSEIQKQLAEKFQAANREQDRLKAGAMQLSDAIKVSYRGFVDTIRQSITDINKRISEARNRIKESQDYIQSLPKTIGDIVFQKQLDFATPAQQIEVINSRISVLQQQIEENYKNAAKLDAEGQRGAIASAKQANEEILRLIGDRFSKQVEMSRTAAQAQGIPTIGVDVGGLKGELEAQGERQIQLERRLQAELRTTIDHYKQLSAEENRRLRTAEQASSDFFRFQKAFQEGTFEKVKEFQKGGKFDEETMRKAVAGSINTIIATQGAQATEAFLKLQSQLKDQSILMFGISEAEKTKTLIAGEQNRVKIQLENAQRVESERKELLNNFRRVIQEGSLDDAEKQLKTFKTIFEQSKSFLTFGALGPRFEFIPTEEANKGLTLLEQVKQKFTELKQKQVDLNDPKALSAYREQLSVLNQQLQDLAESANAFQLEVNQARARAGQPPTREIPGATAPDQTIDNLTKITLNAMAKVDQAISLLQTKSQETLQFLELPGQMVQAAGENFRQHLLNVATTANDAGQKAGVELDNTLGTALRGLDSQLETVRRKIEALGQIRIPTVPNVGGQPQAEGGYLTGPHGADNIPIWAQRGEMIINRDATAAFKPLLDVMNSSIRPGYYGGGGIVNNNVGAINIHSQITGNTDKDVRAFGRQLQREVRRGNIKLS